ncbi:MAG: hypothetical protein NTY53_23735, partial [Kiritimatiellaeota bacterium]|nr:hypothetical protein [Kiritimatiellota bacterium]
MPDEAPTAQPPVSPVASLMSALANLPAEMRETLLTALVKGCSFEKRGKSWRLRTRITLEGQRRKFSFNVGHDDASVQRLQEAIRILRAEARGPQLSPEESAEQAARKHRRAELRRLFIKVAHGSRGLKRDVFQALIEGGLLNM